MKKIKKILLFSLIICSLNLLFNDIVFAADCVACGTSANNPPSSTGDNSDSGSGKNICKDSERAIPARQDCGIGIGYRYESGVYADIYNYNGILLGNMLEIENQKFTAGRFAGLDIYEKYSQIITAYINPYCTQVTLSCHKKISEGYYKPVCIYEIPAVTIGRFHFPWRCLKWGEEYVEPRYGAPYTVTSGDCGDGERISSACVPCEAKKVYECRDEAEDILKNIIKSIDKTPLYEAKIRDVNDINNKNTSTIDYYIEEDKAAEILPKDRNASAIYQEYTLKIKYNPQKTCINVKTGNIRYIKFEQNCDSNTELTIDYMYNADGEKIGKYFIPLNAKSNSSYEFILKAKKKQLEGICLDIVNKYTDGRWKYLLLDKNGQKFTNSTTVAEATKRISGTNAGCYYSAVIDFNIEQKFYNEVSSNGNLAFEGYTFYYKPIDINNPFPNKITSDSYWYGIYNENTNKVTIKDAQKGNITTDLNDSFKNISYSISNINTNSIRNYNYDNKYTSWQNMDVNGSSNFVKSYLTINGKQEYYRLGCGPSNANWEECKK